MGMPCVYEVRDGVRVKEEGRTTFVEVEMDIAPPEGTHQPHTGVALWSTTGKWEDVPSSAPAFASRVGPGIEETFWRDMESAPSLPTPVRLRNTGDSRPRDLGIYERPGPISYPRSPNRVIQVEPRPASDTTHVSGASTMVGSRSPTPGDVLSQEEARTANRSSPTYNGGHSQRT